MCEAIQQSDQKCCPRCQLVWDMNDPEPPECLTDEQINQQVAREAVRSIRREFNHGLAY